MKPGERVGALSHITETEACLFGYGVYEGDYDFGDTDTPAGWVYDMIAKPAGLPNPRIRLDNGKVVWGCECWWGPEDIIKKKIAGKTVVEIDIDAARSEIKESE